MDLEFGTHGFLMNHVFLPTEQAETYMSGYIHPFLLLYQIWGHFDYRAIVLPKMHIVQWGGGGEDEDEDEEEREPCDAAAKSPASQDGSCCKCVSGKTTIMMIIMRMTVTNMNTHS